MRVLMSAVLLLTSLNAGVCFHACTGTLSIAALHQHECDSCDDHSSNGRPAERAGHTCCVSISTAAFEVSAPSPTLTVLGTTAIATTHASQEAAPAPLSDASRCTLNLDVLRNIVLLI